MKLEVTRAAATVPAGGLGRAMARALAADGVTVAATLR